MLNNDYSYIDSLVEKIKSNDLDSFWELFSFYEPMVLSCVKDVALKYKTVESDDLYSESIFVVKNLCYKYDPTKSNFTFFLGSRIQPYLIAEVKKKYVAKIHEVHWDSCESELIQSPESLEDTLFVKGLLAHLSDKEREVIDMFYFQRLTQVQCAKILNITQPAFNQKLKKILSILRAKAKN